MPNNRDLLSEDVTDVLDIPAGLKKVLVMNPMDHQSWIVKHKGKNIYASSFVVHNGQLYNFGAELVTYGKVTLYR